MLLNSNTEEKKNEMKLASCWQLMAASNNRSHVAEHSLTQAGVVLAAAMRRQIRSVLGNNLARSLVARPSSAQFYSAELYFNNQLNY